MDEPIIAPWRALRHYAEQRRPVQIVVAPTADAAAASKSMQLLLRRHNALFEVNPVAQFDDLQAVTTRNAEACYDGEQEYILIGCGGAFDLTAAFPWDAVTSVHVVDSHRPVHLANVRDERVVLWSAEQIELDIARFMQHHHRKRLRKQIKRRRDGVGSDSSSLESTDSEASDSSDEEEDDLGNIDWREGVPARLEQQYYSTLWAGRSAAATVFDLVVHLGHTTDGAIWNAAIGTTDLYLRRLVPFTTYEVEYHRFAAAVSQASLSRRTLAGVDDAPHASGASAKLVTTVEHGLFLLRHTTLWAAVWHDSELAAQLKLHHAADGAERLRSLFARIGISQRDACRPWSDLTQEARRRALFHLEKELKAAGVVAADRDMTVPAIARVEGFSPEMTSIDAVRLFDAELCRVPPTALPQEKLPEYRRELFWAGSAVLDAAAGSKLFNAALAEATQLAHLVAESAAALMPRGLVVRTATVHYALLDGAGRAAFESFWTPPRLRALAEHLALALNVDRRAKRLLPRPLMLGCPRPGSADYTVVCTAHDPLGALHVEPAVAECVAGLKDVEGDAARQLELLPRCFSISGKEQASHYMESVHLRSHLRR